MALTQPVCKICEAHSADLLEQRINDCLLAIEHSDPVHLCYYCEFLLLRIIESEQMDDSEETPSTEEIETDFGDETEELNSQGWKTALELYKMSQLPARSEPEKRKREESQDENIPVKKQCK